MDHDVDRTAAVEDITHAKEKREGSVNLSSRREGFSLSLAFFSVLKRESSHDILACISARRMSRVVSVTVILGILGLESVLAQVIVIFARLQVQLIRDIKVF